MTQNVCPDRLSDKAAIVTGSTHGIGLGIARRFAAEGASVVINDHGEYDGTDIADKISKEFQGEATYIRADVKSPDDIERMISIATEFHDNFDIMVNNVGDNITNADPETLDTDAWEDVMNVSLRSQWLCTKHVLQHLSNTASIINISSPHGQRTVAGFFPYNVAKAGVNGLTRALAVELGDLGIRVNAIVPGAIEIDPPEASTKQLQKRDNTDPLGRLGRPSDVAGLAAFLASEDASYITGAIIPVDGGRSALQPSTDEGR